ncbi:ribonuclease-like 3 [Electrophorus electricus]|uniref:ribonuclease-like 3 n=1 Tax=Electrophorus electricus TaxID=8005 RepID=UPI0015D010DB|nr:ribonuclease-like 3 [Electrophorus electricus]
MEIRGFAVGLLLALSATLLVDAQPADVRSRYIHFLTQHVYGGMNTNKCSKVIGQRHITEGNTNNCKEINTFILATHEQVRAVCSDGGTPKGRNLYESTKPFAVVICKRKPGASCVYNGKRSTRTIIVACDRGWPVHYQEDNLVLH